MANPRVSQEEVRARRLAREAEAQEKANQSQSEITEMPFQSSLEAAGGVAEQVQPDTQPVAEAPPQPTPAPEPRPVIAPANSPANLEALLASLTPEQLARIRQKAIGQGVVAPAALGGVKSADGSLTLSVTLDPMATEQLEIWAEADGCSLVEEAQKRIAESLNNYLYGDWNPVPETVPVAAPAAATAAK